VITHVETALATEGESTALPRIHEALAKRELLPGEHLVDTTSGSADLLASSQTDYGIELICPVRAFPELAGPGARGVWLGGLPH
jgi:hypothetical protein